ncbi:MAG: START domain-containing protein [Chitinophagales bacterium]
MKSITIFSILAVMLFGGFNAAHAEEEWSLSRDKDGIKIYTRKYKDYNYKEYKGIVIVDGKVSDLVAILKDIQTYDKWSYNCVPNTAKVLKKDEVKGEYYVYMEIKAPIVSNRDVVTLYKFHKPASDGSVLVEFWGEKDYIPKKDGLVRVPELVGYWKAIPMGNGKIKIVHQAFSHPGGSPPASLVNGANVNAPFSMLSIIRDMIQK